MALPFSLPQEGRITLKNPLHILIANNLYPPVQAGGAELIVSYLAEGLAARGHRVSVVSTCGPEMEPYPVESRNGVEVIRFFPRNLYWSFARDAEPPYKKALWHLRDGWNRHAGARFRAILAERRPDVVHTHVIDGMSASLWRRARQAGIPVVHTAHDYHLLCPRAVMLTRAQKVCVHPTFACRAYRRWHLATCRYVDLFCSPSHFLLEKHLAAGLRVRKTAVVGNGIPLPATPATGRDHSTRRFLFASRLTVEKGCQVLLDALRLLPQGLAFELTVAGKGPFEEAFRAAAAADARVRFLGFVAAEAKDEVFQASDCLLLPSLWYENAPVVIAEAAAYGMGVIGSDIGAIPEFVRHGETGLLFEAGNAAALAQTMERIIREDALLMEFTAQGRKMAENGEAGRMRDGYEKEYRGLLGIA